MKYSLKANVKRLTGPPHPEREGQFQHIAAQREAFLVAGLPVISIDTKKKELIGDFQNAGRSWCREADAVNVVQRDENYASLRHFWSWVPPIAPERGRPRVTPNRRSSIAA